MHRVIHRVAIVVALLLALAGSALAIEYPQIYDGLIEAKVTSKNGARASISNNFRANLRFNNVNGSSGQSSWRLDAEFGNFLAVNGNTPKLGKFRLELNEPRFTVAIWGNSFRRDPTIEAPFGHVSFNRDAHGSGTSFLFDPSNNPLRFALRVEPDNTFTYVFFEQPVGDLTVGAALRNGINAAAKHENIVSGYFKGNLGALTDTAFTASMRMGNQLGSTEDQWRVAGKFTMRPSSSLRANIEASYHAENWGNDGRINAEIIHPNPSLGEIKTEFLHRIFTNGNGTRQQRVRLTLTKPNTEIFGEYNGEPSLTETDNKTDITLRAIWRATTAVKFGDLFKTGDYHKNTGMAAGVQVTLSTDHRTNPNAATTTTVVGNLGGRLQPGGRWFALVTGQVQLNNDGRDWSVADAAGDNKKLGAGPESKMGLSVQVNARYVYDGNFNFDPWARYGSGTEGANSNTLMAAGLNGEYNAGKFKWFFNTGFGMTNINGASDQQSRLETGLRLEF